MRAGTSGRLRVRTARIAQRRRSVSRVTYIRARLVPRGCTSPPHAHAGVPGEGIGALTLSRCVDSCVRRHHTRQGSQPASGAEYSQVRRSPSPGCCPHASAGSHGTLIAGSRAFVIKRRRRRVPLGRPRPRRGPAVARRSPWPSASPPARRATHRLSRLSWQRFMFREVGREGRGPGRRPFWRITRIHPALSGGISAGVGSALSSPSRPTRSVIVCGEAAPEVAHRLSTPGRTSSATRSSDASTGSSSGAAWPCERINRHRLPGRTPPRRHPHLGPAVGRRLSDRPPSARPQARIPCLRCAPRA
jgi:hypothetical protein